MFKTPEELKERASTLRGGMQPSEQQLAVAKVLAKVAEEVGAKGNLTGGTSVAICPTYHADGSVKHLDAVG